MPYSWVLDKKGASRPDSQWGTIMGCLAKKHGPAWHGWQANYPFKSVLCSCSLKMQPRTKKMGCDKNTTLVYVKQMKHSKNEHFWNGHIMATNINIGGCFLKMPIIKLDVWKNSDTLKYQLPILLIGLSKKLVTYSLWDFKCHLQATMPNPGLALPLYLTPKRHSQARRPVGDNYQLPSNKTWPCLAWLASTQPFLSKCIVLVPSKCSKATQN